jgi:2-polyprenyl-3-methyl-5-hydroxy-6-metoxy-1,4-benzoquinol methylase
MNREELFQGAGSTGAFVCLAATSSANSGNTQPLTRRDPEEFILKTISVFWLTVAVSLAPPSWAGPQTRSATQESRSSAKQQKSATAAQTRTPDVIYVPTPPEVVDKMLRMAGVKEGDVLYDLGSGDGRIVIAAAKQHKVRGVGIDIDPQRIREAEENARAAGVADLVRFRNEDLFQANISEATVVTLYLLESLNEKLRPKLMRDLKPGTRIVSHAFRMGDWEPERSDDVNGIMIYFWTVPAKTDARR